MKTHFLLFLLILGQRLRYWGELINLHCLETSLSNKRQALQAVSDPVARAAMARSIQPLFLEVAFATNRVIKLRHAFIGRRSWRSA